MKKYCRYCAAKMSDPRDKFCYSCRKPGRPVGFLYRYAKKVDLDEDEIDLIREYGEDISFCGLILGAFVAVLLIISLVFNAVGAEKDHVSGVYLAVMFVILAVLLVFAGIGIGLMRLDKRVVSKEWMINIIMVFVGLFRSRRSGAAIISAAMTHNKKVERERLLRAALIHLASGEKRGGNTAPKPAETNQQLSDWECRFCGYKNPSSRIECKSCGKTK